LIETPDVDATVRKIEVLLEDLREADPHLREGTEEIIRLLMHLYGSGFARAIEILGNESAGRLAEDKLVSSLLLLHGLHPVPAEMRVQEALHRVERKLNGHRLLVREISDHIARIQVDSNGGPPAPSSLAAAIERAIAECAPDVTGVEIEGLAQPAASLVQIAPAASR
jgi:hypothetical protein